MQEATQAVLRKLVAVDNVSLATQCRADHSSTSRPPRDFRFAIARHRNQTPLLLMKPYSAPRSYLKVLLDSSKLKSSPKKASTCCGKNNSSPTVGEILADPVLPHLAHQPHKPCLFQLKYGRQCPSQGKGLQYRHLLCSPQL